MITCASAQISGRWKVAKKGYLSLLVIDFFFRPICIELGPRHRSCHWAIHDLMWLRDVHGKSDGERYHVEIHAEL